MFRTPHAPFSHRNLNPAARPAILRRAALGAAMVSLARLLLIAIMIAAGAATAWAQTGGAEQKHFQVPAGDMAEALNLFARQAGIAVDFDPAAVAGRLSPALEGRHAIDDALERLLAGHDLVVTVAGQDPYALRIDSRGDRRPDDRATVSDVTVTGTSMALAVNKYPGSVTVLGEEELRGTSTVIEALADVPGVSTGGDSGRGMGQQFNIRGFGYQSEDRVIILQDGVRRSPSLYSNQVSSFRSDNDLLKSVEVVKGASSVHHGGGAIGGVVAMTTKDAHDFLAPGREMGVATQLRYESNNYREGYVAGAVAPADGPYEFLLYGKLGRHGDKTLARKYETADGGYSDTVDNKEDLRVIFTKGALHLGGGSRIALSYYDFHQDAEVTWQSLYHPGYSTVTGPVIGTLTQRDLVATYSLNPYGSRWVNLQATAYKGSSSYDRGYEYVAASGLQQKLDYENKDDRWGLRLHNQMVFNALAARNRVLIGLDHENREEDASYVLNGVATVFGSMPNTYRDTGLFVHLESAFFNEAIIVQAGGRYDTFDRRVKANAGKYTDEHFSPRIGLAVRLFDGFHLLGNYSESFRAPTPHETSSEGPLNRHYWYLPNPDLKPEIAREYEAGLSYAKTGLVGHRDRLMFKAMYFNGKIKDMIAFKADLDGPVSPEGTPYGTYRNVDSVSRDGYEISAMYDAPRWGARMSYSHLDQVDDATNEKTPQGFADKATLGAYIRPLHTLRVGASVTHWFKPDQNPETVVSGGTTYWYVRESFTQANVAATWAPEVKGLSLFGRTPELTLGVNNLFDDAYINARDVETTTRVGKGRNVYLSVATRF